MVGIKIVGVHERDAMITAMNNELRLPDADIVYDTREGGGYAFPILKQAWLAPYAEGETHRVVLNDDLEVCEGFHEICEQIAAAHPYCIVSFFSTYYNSSYCDEEIAALQTPYVTHDRGIFGCAIMMPKDVAIECMSYTDEHYPGIKFESHAFHQFALERGIPVISTLPCLVQHLGDDSLVDKHLPIRRTERFVKHPEADWSCSDVETIKAMMEMTRPLMKPINWK